MPPRKKLVFSGAGDGASKGKANGKGKGKSIIASRVYEDDEVDAEGQQQEKPSVVPSGKMIDVEDAAVAADSGDVPRLSVFLGQLLPGRALRGGAEQKCMKRALVLLDSRWKTEVEQRRKATFASEDARLVDAVLMGGVYLPSDAFALAVEYMDHATAVRSMPCSRAWWRTISALPPASHINTRLGSDVGWQDLVSQLKIIRASNPRREVNRITLGYCVKVGNLGNLCKAAGGVLRYLDLTYSKGVKNIGFRELAAQLPNLKGLAIEETFYPHEYVQGWLRGLTELVHKISLESLRLNAHEFSCSPNTNPRSKAKWESHNVSKIGDRFFELLVNVQLPSFMMSDTTPFSSIGLNDRLWTTDAPRGDGIFYTSIPSLNHRLLPSPSTLRKLHLKSPADGPTITAGMAEIGAGMPHLEELLIERLKVSDEGWRKFAEISIAAAAPTSTAAATPTSTAAAAVMPAARHGVGSADCDGSVLIDKKKPTLRRITIQTNGSLSVPSSATRDLLQDAVSEDVTIFLDGKTSRSVTIGGSGSRGGASAPTSHGGGGVVYLDCEGAIIEVNGGSSSAGGGAAVGNAKVGKLFIMPGQWGLTCGLGAEDL